MQNGDMVLNETMLAHGKKSPLVFLHLPSTHMSSHQPYCMIKASNVLDSTSCPDLHGPRMRRYDLSNVAPEHIKCKSLPFKSPGHVKGSEILPTPQLAGHPHPSSPTYLLL
jgi:hypothetical protein